MNEAEGKRLLDILANRPGNYYSTANDQERQIFRDWVTGILRQQEVTIDFEKNDGSFRSMTCTLLESRLPPAINKTTHKKANLEVCTVWDSSQEAWRSFRWDRVKRIAFILG